MFINYLKISIRNLLRFKVFSFINISGLAIGMACCLLILLWVMDELSYDRFHKNANDLYRVVQNIPLVAGYNADPILPAPLGPTLKREYPEILDAVRIVPPQDAAMSYGDKLFKEKFIAVEPSFLKMFTFTVIQGDPNTALNSPLSIVLTKQIAEKYFGDENPIGKVLKVNNRTNFTVTAVLENIPHNSHISFDILIPYMLVALLRGQADNWGANNLFTYVQLKEGTNPHDVNNKISGIINKQLEKKYTSNFYKTKVYLQPLKKVYFNSYFPGFSTYTMTQFALVQGNLALVYIFSTIAVLVLLIACINFMNLSTARSMNRVKEIGIRKVVGSRRIQLIAQFIGESFLLTVLALFIAIMLVELFLPLFNSLSDKQLSIDIFSNWRILVGIFVITLITGIVAGSYPALYLSAFQPIQALKGMLTTGKKAHIFRNVLVILQYAIAIILMICMGILFSQQQYAMNKDIGYDIDNLVVINKSGGVDFKKFNSFKADLLQNKSIKNITLSGENPTMIASSTMVTWEGNPSYEPTLFGIHYVDYDYIETFKIKMAEGRSFSKDISSDRSAAVIINEAAAKLMNIKSPLFPSLKYIGDANQNAKQIIGIVKDFHFQDLSQKIGPLALMMFDDKATLYAGNVIIRIDERDKFNTIQTIKKSWMKIFPDHPFDYHFLDQDYRKHFGTLQKTSELCGYFAFLSIFIACLGILGLVSFSAEQRTKEVGIRKTFGASTFRIITLLCKKYMFLVLVAIMFSCPVAYIVMKKYLEDFAYRVDISWLYFVASAVFTFIVAILTVSYKAYKAATANPVDSLRYE